MFWEKYDIWLLEKIVVFYNSEVDDIDLFVGGVVEIFLDGVVVGLLFFCIIGN